MHGLGIPCHSCHTSFMGPKHAEQKKTLKRKILVEEAAKRNAFVIFVNFKPGCISDSVQVNSAPFAGRGRGRGRGGGHHRGNIRHIGTVVINPALSAIASRNPVVVPVAGLLYSHSYRILGITKTIIY